MIPEIRPPSATTRGSAQARAKPVIGAAAFAGGRRRRVAAQEAEEEVGRQLEGGVERDRPETADDADQRTEDDPLAEVVRSPQAAPDRTKAGVELWGERRHANCSSPAAIARSPVLDAQLLGSGQPRGDLAQGRAPMGKDRLADRPAAVGQPGSRGAPVQLVDGQGRQPAPFESAKQAARRRQRDADPRRDLADPRPVRLLAQHEQGTPLRKRQLEARVRQRQGAGREPHRANGDPLKVVGERVDARAGHDRSRSFFDGHGSGWYTIRCQVAIIGDTPERLDATGLWTGAHQLLHSATPRARSAPRGRSNTR